MLAKLLEQDHRQEARAGKAARRDMERRRRLVIAPHRRQENLSRTVWITFHWRGTTSSVSVTSSPSFESFVDPQQRQLCGAATTIRSSSKCSGKGFRAGRLRSKDLTVVEGAERSAANSSSVASAVSVGYEAIVEGWLLNGGRDQFDCDRYQSVRSRDRAQIRAKSVPGPRRSYRSQGVGNSH
jgi:hypothetical protein